MSTSSSARYDSELKVVMSIVDDVEQTLHTHIGSLFLESFFPSMRSRALESPRWNVFTSQNSLQVMTLMMEKIINYDLFWE